MAGMVGIKQKVAALAVVLLAALASPACQTNGARCAPGDYVACACPTRVLGFARCAPSGEEYSLCDCSGALPPGVVDLEAGAHSDGPASDDAGDATSGKLPFMSPCAKDVECETGLCFVFTAKGPRCSKGCQVDTDCPPPSPGCNLQGICKSP
jgi:hypothetical protein